MKAVLISIRPKWCGLIASGKKTIEVRKTCPKLETPFKVYIYRTLPKSGDWNNRDGHVIGEFVCDSITEYAYGFSFNEEHACISLKVNACLSGKDVFSYAGKGNVYGWHISKLKIYDKPKKLTDFIKPCDPDPDGVPLCFQCKRLVENYGCGGTIIRPPQSWMYVEELEGGNDNA